MSAQRKAPGMANQRRRQANRGTTRKVARHRCRHSKHRHITFLLFFCSCALHSNRRHCFKSLRCTNTMASPTTLPASATTAAPLQNNLYVSQTDNSVFCLQTVFVIFWVWCCGFVLSFLISSSVMGSIGIAVMAIAIVLLVVGIGQMVRAKKRVRSQAAMLRPMVSRLPPFWFSH